MSQQLDQTDSSVKNAAAEEKPDADRILHAEVFELNREEGKGRIASVTSIGASPDYLRGFLEMLGGIEIGDIEEK